MMLKIGITEWKELAITTKVEIAMIVTNSETQKWIAENSERYVVLGLLRNPSLKPEIAKFIINSY